MLERMYRYYPSRGIRRPSDHRYQSSEDWNGGRQNYLCIEFSDAYAFIPAYINYMQTVARPPVASWETDGPIQWYNLTEPGSLLSTTRSGRRLLPSALTSSSYQLIIDWSGTSCVVRLEGDSGARELTQLADDVAAPVMDDAMWPFGTLWLPLDEHVFPVAELTSKEKDLRGMIRTMCQFQYRAKTGRLPNLYLAFLETDGMLTPAVIDLSFSPFIYLQHTPDETDATFVLRKDLALVARVNVSGSVENPKWFCPMTSILFPE